MKSKCECRNSTLQNKKEKRFLRTAALGNQARDPPSANSQPESRPFLRNVTLVSVAFQKQGAPKAQGWVVWGEAGHDEELMALEASNDQLREVRRPQGCGNTVGVRKAGDHSSKI